MRFFHILAVAALSASLLSSAVRADDELPPELSPTRPIAEVAAMLAYDYCPRVLSGTMDVSGSWEVQQLGFAGELLDREEPEFDYPLFMLEANRFDGKLGFAGRVQNACEVIVQGENRMTTRTVLREHLIAHPDAFKPEPTLSAAGVETYSVPTRSGRLLVRLKDNQAETILQLSVEGCSTCRP